jgi:hypothetical protein
MKGIMPKTIQMEAKRPIRIESIFMTAATNRRRGAGTIEIPG